MTTYKGVIYSAHSSTDNVLLSIRTPDGDYISDANFSPDEAEAIARLLVKAAKDARKIKP